MSQTAPAPLLALAITPHTDEDRKRLGRGLAWLMGEDPSLTVEIDVASNQFIIFAMGEQHLDIIIDRLRREFEVQAAVGRPAIIYRETVTRRAAGETRFIGEIEGRRHYAHVQVEVYPRESGSGCVFENAILAGVIPDEFVQPIHDGVTDALAHGVLAGYAVMDVRVVLTDGSHHEEESSAAAFRVAAARAVGDALKKGGPVLLEPVMRVEVTTPGNYLADVTANLSARGRVQSTAAETGAAVVTALVPLAALFGYTSDLRERTYGHASFVTAFAGYQRFDAFDEGDSGRDSFVGAPLRPAPTRNVSSVALPEPADDRIDGADARGRPAQ